MSTSPDSSGPSVTKTDPSGLQSSPPPTSGTLSTTRDAVTARCSASTASGSAAPRRDRVSSTAARASSMLRSGSSARLATGGGGELAGGGHPSLLLGLAPLVERDEPADQGDDQRDGDGGALRRAAGGWPAPAGRCAPPPPAARGRGRPCWPRGTLARGSGRSACCGTGVVEGDLEPRAAVERPGVAAELDPGAPPPRAGGRGP